MNQQQVRTQSFDRMVNIKENKSSQPIDVIQQTRKLVQGLDEVQRFRIAQIHLLNALNQRTPRLDTFSPNLPKMFRICYRIQTSTSWRFFLLVVSYIFMYLIVWGNKPTPPLIIFFEVLMLFFGWADVIMEIYHKKFQVLKVSSRFELRFYIRTIILLLLIVDLILVIIAPEWKIRPLILFRCLLPLFYDTNVRKAFQALLSSYKDILVFLLFYSVVIVCFAIITHQIVQLPNTANIDPISSDYHDLGKSIFIMYVLATYDAYPDNQMVAINTSMWLYVYFICFIILNAFFFVNIPVALIFNSFRQTRSKIIIIDQIKQQHSLIMSFVSLGQQNLLINKKKLIRFLLFFYKRKIRYIDQIVLICQKLDEHNDGVIHVNQYMQLTRIIKSDKEMFPPAFHDWKRWSQFQYRINSIFGLKKLVKSDVFRIVTCVIIIITFVNGVISLYTTYRFFDVFDDITILFFICQLIIKFIGLGYQQFFRDPWNKLDMFLITLAFIFQLVPFNVGPRNASTLLKMARIFRIGTIIKIFETKKRKRNKSHQFYEKSVRLIKQTIIIIPTILRFFPFFLVTFYVISVAAMSFFQQNNIVNTSQSPYGTYDDYSNFRSFIFSHILLVQILVQSAWSTLAYHHVFKFGNYPLTMLFFVGTHMIIVTIISSLLKGVIWEVYNALNDEFNQRKVRKIKQRDHQRQMEKKRAQIQQVKQKVNSKQHLIPDNLVVKKLYQNKIDMQILNSLRKTYEHQSQMFKSRSKIKVSDILKEVFNQYVDSRNNSSLQSIQSRNRVTRKTALGRLRSVASIENIQDLQIQDIQDELQKMLSDIILTKKVNYSASIAHPKILQDYLTLKFKAASNFNPVTGFNIRKDIIQNKKSVQFLTHTINALLDIQISQKQQKGMVVQTMIQEGIITQNQCQKVMSRKTTSDKNFDSNWMMRKAFLAGSNQKLIDQFQLQYFQDVYGKSFKLINKVTIEPLLHLQSKLTYCLRNTLRYRQMDLNQFFIILTRIQDTISNQLLKKGSLFKFVFQLQSVEYWFCIQSLQSKQMKLHFIKNGFWIENRSYKQNQIYFAHDIFKWDDIQKRYDRTLCQKYIKMLYQSFETLAFCSENQNGFFQQNPNRFVFDLFSFFKQVKDTKRFKHQKIPISKIMVVILSKQEQREVPLDYKLSDIKFDQQNLKLKKSFNFKFDQTQKQTYKKLKRMELINYQKLVSNQGIPFPYIINLMRQMQQIIQTHQQNFVFHVQKLFSQIFDEEIVVRITQE